MTGRNKKGKIHDAIKFHLMANRVTRKRTRKRENHLSFLAKGMSQF